MRSGQDRAHRGVGNASEMISEMNGNVFVTCLGPAVRRWHGDHCQFVTGGKTWILSIVFRHRPPWYSRFASASGNLPGYSLSERIPCANRL